MIWLHLIELFFLAVIGTLMVILWLFGQILLLLWVGARKLYLALQPPVEVERS